MSGKLVYAGLADVDFDADLKEKVNGNIVLLDRGKVAFIDKFKTGPKRLGRLEWLLPTMNPVILSTWAEAEELIFPVSV